MAGWFMPDYPWGRCDHVAVGGKKPVTWWANVQFDRCENSKCYQPTISAAGTISKFLVAGSGVCFDGPYEYPADLRAIFDAFCDTAGPDL